MKISFSLLLISFSSGICLPGLTVCAQVAPAGPLHWTGSAAGTWNDSGSGFSTLEGVPAGFPPQPYNSVQIDQNPGQNSTVTLTVNSRIMNLFVDPGDVLQITGGSTLELAGVPPLLTADQLNIGGILDMTGAGANTLRINVANTFRYGGGEIRMRGAAQIAGPGIYFQGTGSYTGGSGRIGAGGTGINNQGTIHASFPGETLLVYGATRADMAMRIFNSGTFSAGGGGVLEVQVSDAASGLLDNAGGIIQANDASTVRLAGLHLTGGILRTAGSGVISARGRSFNLWEHLTNEGLSSVDGGALTLGQGILNSGTIRSDNFTPQFPDGIRIDSDVTINGGGSLKLGVEAPVLTDGMIAGAGMLTLGTQTVEGHGLFGGDSLKIVISPSGLVKANTGGTSLIIEPPAWGFTNEGLMQAENGGLLLLRPNAGEIIRNAGGIIQALPGSTVRIEGSDAVTGGILRSIGNGILDLRSGGIRDLELEGAAVLSGSFAVAGQITNKGVIRNPALLAPDGTAVLTGGGSIVLGPAPSTFGAVGGSGSLTLANQRIEGRGTVGQNTLNVTVGPLGVVSANVAGHQLSIDPPAAGFTNEGVLQAENGGTLLLSLSGTGETLRNAGGVIQALPGSTVRQSGLDFISGGTLRSVGDGAVELQGGGIRDLRIEGAVRISGGFSLEGVIENSGLIRNLSNLYLGNNTILSGGGVLRLSEAGVAVGMVGGANGHLTLGNQRLEGYGFFGQDSGMSLSVSPVSSIVANVPGAELNLGNNAITVNNSGILRAENGGVLRFYRGTFTVEPGGRVEVLDGSTVNETTLPVLTNRQPGGILSGGTWLVRGRTAAANMTIPGGNITGNSAAIILDGTLSLWPQLNSLESNAGRFELAGSRDFTSAGAFSNSGLLVIGGGSTFTSTGAFSQTGSGKIEVKISGPPEDGNGTGRLILSTPAVLSGLLHVHFDHAGGFLPVAGQVWRVAAGNALTGNFSSVQITGLPPTLQGSAVYLPGGVDIVLTARAAFNYTQWAANYVFQSPADSALTADPDGDGVENSLEFAFLLDPTVSDSHLLPVPHLTGGGLTVSFTQPAGITGVTYGAESSENLTAWPAVMDTGTGGTHTFTTTNSGAKRLFMRLSVIVTP